MLTAFQLPGGFENFLAILIAIFCIGIIALIVGAIWMHGDAQSRGMDATVWVILLIVATLLGGGIVGFVIVFVVYLVVRENHPVGGAMPAPYGMMPPPPVPAACPVCGNPMMWYQQHRRWYYPSCAQYR